MVERIGYEGKVFALILRQDYKEDGANFITLGDEPIQLGVLKHQCGTKIKPHIHKNQPRTISEVQEVLYIAYGKVEAKFYESNGNKISNTILNSGDILEELYKPLEKPIFRTNLKTAEMIKYAANCMLATKISFWNEIFLICRKLGIDSQQVADIVALDPRIGKYGSIHGKAFDGKCLPKDLEAFISFAQEYHNPALLTAVKQINDYMAKNYEVRSDKRLDCNLETLLK